MILSIIKKIFLALIIGTVASLLLLEKSAFIKKQLIAKIIESAPFKNTNVQFELSSINLLFPAIEFNNVNVSQQQDWAWQAKKLCCSFSWFNILFKKELTLSMSFDDLVLFSTVKDNRPTMYEHLQSFFNGTNDYLTFKLQRLTINHGKVCLTDEGKNVTIDTQVNGTIAERQNKLFLSLHFLKGTIEHASTIIVRKAESNVSGTIDVYAPEHTELTFSSSFKTPINHLNRCFIAGSLKNNSAQCSFKDINGLIHIKKTTFDIPKLIVHSQGNAQLELLKMFIPEYSHYIEHAETNFDLNYNFNTQKLSGFVKILNAGQKNLPLDEIKLIFNSPLPNHAKLFAKIKNFHFLGSVKIDTHFNIQAQLTNEHELPLTMFSSKIDPKKLKLHVNYCPQNTHGITYACTLTNTTDLTQAHSAGEITITQERTKINGTYNNLIVDALIKNDQQCSLEHCRIYDINDHNHEKLNSSYRNNKASIVIDYNFIKNYLPKALQERCIGKGSCVIEGAYTDNKKIKATLKIDNANILLPYSYNIIKSIQGTITLNTTTRVLKLNNISLMLNNARIDITKGNILIPEDIKKFPEFICVPITIHNVNITHTPNTSCNFSGLLLLEALNGMPMLSGNIVLESAIADFKDNNAFENQKIASLNGYNALLDLHVITKKPIRFSYDSVECLLHANIKMQGDINAPTIAGLFEINSGVLHFPYKPLKIFDGKITMFNNNVTLDIQAKNKIKDYQIYAQIHGDLNNPEVSLISSPSLSEEQISSLLIAGAPDKHLNIFAPSMIIQNIQSLLFTPSKSLDNSLFKPLQHVKLISQLNEEKIGTIKGGVEIDINDRLYALIQKNINSSDQTSIEVDYMLSDDIRIRGIKDEKGDIAGEIEMKWKF